MPMQQWPTDVTLTADGDGTIAFTGFYGDYTVTLGDQTYPLAVTKGKTDYEIIKP